jgi:hypothetical protein
MNAHYQTGLPDDVVSTLDAMAEADAWNWLNVYKFALWLGLVAVEDQGGLRNAEAALGIELREVVGGWRSVKVPRDARDLVDMAKREGLQWNRAQRIALLTGFKMIENRGGLNATKARVEALRRSVVSQVVDGAP